MWWEIPGEAACYLQFLKLKKATWLRTRGRALRMNYSRTSNHCHERHLRRLEKKDEEERRSNANVTWHKNEDAYSSESSPYQAQSPFCSSWSRLYSKGVKWFRRSPSQSGSAQTALSCYYNTDNQEQAEKAQRWQWALLQPQEQYLTRCVIKYWKL